MQSCRKLLFLLFVAIPLFSACLSSDPEEDQQDSDDSVIVEQPAVVSNSDNPDTIVEQLDTVTEASDVVQQLDTVTEASDVVQQLDKVISDTDELVLEMHQLTEISDSIPELEIELDAVRIRFSNR